MVKCDNHEAGCSWTGSITDHDNHKQSCRQQQNNRDALHRGRSDSDQEHIDLLEQRIEYLLAMIRELKAELAQRVGRSDSDEELINSLNLSTEDMLGHIARLEELRDSHAELEYGNSSLALLSNGKGGYAYDRNSVVKLAKLICQNLENKPNHIDSNRIFECVRNIFTDHKKGYSDNPQHFYMDVRMLYGVCLASTWFTVNQRSNIAKLAAEGQIA